MRMLFMATDGPKSRDSSQAAPTTPSRIIGIVRCADYTWGVDWVSVKRHLLARRLLAVGMVKPTRRPLKKKKMASPSTTRRLGGLAATIRRDMAPPLLWVSLCRPLGQVSSEGTPPWLSPSSPPTTRRHRNHHHHHHNQQSSNHTWRAVSPRVHPTLCESWSSTSVWWVLDLLRAAQRPSCPGLWGWTLIVCRLSPP